MRNELKCESYRFSDTFDYRRISADNTEIGAASVCDPEGATQTHPAITAARDPDLTRNETTSQ